jgi:hypothetical protein
MAWLDDKLIDVTQSPAVAAVIGSLLSLRWMPVGSTWANKLTSLMAGVGLAFWVIPWAVEGAGIESTKAIGAFSFLGGFLGLLVLSRLWDYVSTTPVGEMLTALFKRKTQ